MPTIAIIFNKSNPKGSQFTVINSQGANAKNLRVGPGPITWMISSNSYPSLTMFSNQKPGIQFQPTAETPAVWPNANPSGQGGSWTVNNPGPFRASTTYAYTINVVTPDGTYYSTDPDITNTPNP